MQVTQEGLKKLENELEERKLKLRQEITAKIAEARAQGDLSENAEYDAARDEQVENENRIKELETLIKDVEIVEVSEKDAKSKKINIGSKVTLHDAEFDEDVTYVIVGSTEANSLEGKISNESPIGAALIGHKKGDDINVETPGGIIAFKVLKVEKA